LRPHEGDTESAAKTVFAGLIGRLDLMRARRCLAAALCVAMTLVLGGCSLVKSAASTSTTTSTSTATTTTTSPPTTTTTTSSTTTSTTAVATCTMTSFTIKTGQSSGAAGTIALAFVVTNTSTTACALRGYPTIVLVPESGTVDPVITHIGSAKGIAVAPAGEAGFALEYNDEAVNGGTTCPEISDVDVSLPHVAGASLRVPAHFCPYGQPNLSVSAVLSLAELHDLVG